MPWRVYITFEKIAFINCCEDFYEGKMLIMESFGYDGRVVNKKSQQSILLKILHVCKSNKNDLVLVMVLAFRYL